MKKETDNRRQYASYNPPIEKPKYWKDNDLNRYRKENDIRVLRVDKYGRTYSDTQESQKRLNQSQPNPMKTLVDLFMK